MSLAGSVRRSFRRYVRLDCQVVRERDFRLVGDLALDLSTGGMRVRGLSPVLTGEEVVISFRPPRSNVWVDAEATVARVVHGRRPGDTGLSFGLEFHGVGREEQALIFEQLRGMSATEPLRQRRSLVRAA